MREIEIRLSAEEVEKILSKETTREQKETMAAFIPEYLFLGYGVYGYCLKTDSEGYYISASVGDSCD